MRVMNDFVPGEPKNAWQKAVPGLTMALGSSRFSRSHGITLILLTVLPVAYFFFMTLFQQSIAARFTDSFEDVALAYHDILGRDVDFEELKRSVSALVSGGLTTHTLRTNLMNSVEGKTRNTL